MSGRESITLAGCFAKVWRLTNVARTPGPAG